MKNVLCLTMAVLVMTSAGCAGVRKKFVRARQTEKEPVVYVDYKEYSQVPSRENYKNYYVFAQGWLSEALQSLATNGNRKKQRQAFSEALVNMEQMLYFLDEEGKAELSVLYRRVQAVQEDTAVIAGNEMKKTLAVNELEFLIREFKRKFTMSNAAQWMD